MLTTNGGGPRRRAVLYARVSTEEQVRSGYSLAQQMEALRDHATREGYEILEEVSDPGQSGATLARPGMDRVRDLVAAGGVAVVLVVQDRDRLVGNRRFTTCSRRSSRSTAAPCGRSTIGVTTAPRGSSRRASWIRSPSTSG